MPVDTLLEPSTRVLNDMLQRYEQEIRMSSCGFTHLTKKNGDQCNGGQCNMEFGHSGYHTCSKCGESF